MSDSNSVPAGTDSREIDSTEPVWPDPYAGVVFTPDGDVYPLHPAGGRADWRDLVDVTGPYSAPGTLR